MSEVKIPVTFNQQFGSTQEVMLFEFTYCKDQNADGFDDILVSFRIDPSSNSGTEDIIGIAFDVAGNAVSGLSITDIQRTTTAGTLSTFNPVVVIGADKITDNPQPPGNIDPGFNTSGDGQTGTGEPFDIGIKLSDQGSGEGIVQGGSFIITKAGADADASVLLSNTSWYIRLQSTNGGDGSAKEGGEVLTLPPCPDGMIEGHKYLDTNGDLAGGRGTALSGWTINLYEIGDLDGDGTANELVGTKITDANGYYKFDDLFYGTYRVEEVLKDGWYATSSVSVNATLSATDKEETVDFNNTEKGSIGGHKYIDRDGVLGGSTDPGQGWTIKLYKDTNNDNALDSGDVLAGTTVTDSTGAYNFTNLVLGNYIVVETQKAGFTNLTSLVVGADLTISGQQITDANFTNANEVCYEGLTPGFWKQSQNWSKVTIDQSTKAFWQGNGWQDSNTNGSVDASELLGLNFKNVFDLPSNTWLSVGTNITLLQALNLGGNEGSVEALFRHSTAAVLNASVAKHQGNAFDYLIAQPQDVVDLMVEANAVGTRTAALDLKNDLAYLNELGTQSDWASDHLCPPVASLTGLFTTVVGNSGSLWT